MLAQPDSNVWLENQNHGRISIRGNCSLGRASGNEIVLSSDKVSRRHAIIHVQDDGEFWLIDLGSSNGTYLNNRRVHHPVRLCDQDSITLGGETFTFRLAGEGAAETYETTFAKQTVQDIQHVACWLLIADIEDFTPLSRSLVAEKLAMLVGGWVLKCKEIIEQHGGTINKYLGDGFIAYWRDMDSTPANVAAVIALLKKLQGQHSPRFRVVVHCGLVAIGGTTSLGEESMMGKEVNLAFRLEKLAGLLSVKCLASEAAHERLAALVEARPAGEHELKGFEGRHVVFSL